MVIGVKKRMRLSRRLFPSIILILFVIYVFLAFVQGNRKRITEQNLEYIQDSTVQAANRIDDVLAEAHDNIRILSAFLSQSLDQPEVDIERVRELAKDSVFDFIEFADKNGMDHNITGGVSDARDRQYYLDGIQGNVGLEVIFNSRATHETLLMFYAPVVFEEETVGVLIGAYQAENRLKDLLTISYFGEQADLYLCTPEGKVAATNLPLNTNDELNIVDLLGEDDAMADRIRQTIDSGENLVFTYGENETGGCMIRLQDSGWFLAQVFPESVNSAMFNEANALGIRLEISLLAVFGVAMVLLIYFYRKDREHIEELAEERGRYKNAVLADAMIVFEVNLTKNRILEGEWKTKDGKPVSIEKILNMHLPCNYETYITNWAMEYVDEGARDLFLKYTGSDYLKELFAQGKSEATFEYYARSLDGEKIFVRRSIYLAKDKKSGDLIAYSNVKDITEQKEQENRMHQYEQILINTASGMYQGVKQIDLDDFSTVYLSFANDHITITDIGDWNTWLDEQEQAVHTDDIKKLRDTFGTEQLMEMPLGGSLRCGFRSREKNENGIYKSFYASAFKTELDEKIYVNLVTMDNTLTVENEMRQKAMLEDALLRAENASRAKTVFLSNMSHDIRTPMNAIIGFTALATEHIDNREKVLNYLEKITTSSSHLLSLINDVLDMSRIESGKIQLEETECNLADVIYELRNILISEMKVKGLDFYIDTVDLVDEQIICDKLRLKQILLNIIGNSIKFTNPGGSISIRIIEKQGEDSKEAVYEFHIKDTGIGMSEEFQKHIFEPFERERSSTVSGMQGTGLGMSITKNIVDMMGGTVTVQSRKNKGTEFIVQLPMRKASLESRDFTIKELEGVHALVVDDDFNSCDSISAMLAQIGMRADWTMYGREAIMRTHQAIQREDPYGVYIIDWMMPDVNGAEVTRQVRREVGDKCLIIILSAYEWEEIKEEAKAAGATVFLSKPLFISGLYRCLNQIVDPQEEDKKPKIKKEIEGQRVLLVEDNDLNREIAREILSETGLIVEEAVDGSIAVERLLEKGAGYYDLVLMDIQMPIMDGYQAAQKIRSFEDRELAAVPIIAMTANAFVEDKKKALEVGMNAHVSKPINVKELLDTIERILLQD